MSRARATRGERGQAMVEFALVLPLILALALAVVLVGEIGIARVALQHAAAEGARAAALTNDDAVAHAAVAAAVAPLAIGDVSVTIEPTQAQPPRTADPRGSLVRVHLRYTIPVPLGFAGLAQVTIDGAAARRMEWSP